MEPKTAGFTKVSQRFQHETFVKPAVFGSMVNALKSKVFERVCTTRSSDHHIQTECLKTHYKNSTANPPASKLRQREKKN
jgi:hypothetical protein